MNFTYSDELYHHGIKGQKWGVRRYKNEDGSLTSEGKKRLSKYKAKELKRIDRKYKIRKYTAPFKDSRNLNKIRKRIESDYVKKMTYSDMEKEIKTVRGKKAKMFAASIAASAVLLPTTGRTITFIPRSGNIKTNYRLSNSGNEYMNLSLYNSMYKFALDEYNKRKKK